MSRAIKPKVKKIKTAFVYSDRFGAYYYGIDHPMKPVRLRLAYELLEELGLNDLPSSRRVEARPAAESDLLLFHTPEYVKVLKEANTGIIPVGGSQHGLGYADNPVFKGVYEWSALCAGASLQAAELVAEGKADVAFNMAGGPPPPPPQKATRLFFIKNTAAAVTNLR